MSDDGKILIGRQDQTTVLKLCGEIRVTLGPTIVRFLSTLGNQRTMTDMVVDLRDTTFIDSTGLGVLAKISLVFEKLTGRMPTLVCPDPDINEILHAMGFHDIFVLVTDLALVTTDGIELPTEQTSEEELRRQVIEAHRVLMGLNEENEMVFKDLVEALEEEDQKNMSQGERASTTSQVAGAS